MKGTAKRRKERAEHIRMTDMKVPLEVTHMENVNHKSSNRDALFLRRKLSHARTPMRFLELCT